MVFLGLKYLNSWMRIRDPGWKKVGSGIRDKHPGSATLLPCLRKEYLLIDCHLFFSREQAEGRPPGDGAVRASAPGIHEKERHQSFQGK